MDATYRDLVSSIETGMYAARDTNANGQEVTLVLYHSEAVRLLGRQRMTKALRTDLSLILETSRLQVVEATDTSWTLSTKDERQRTSFQSVSDLQTYLGK